MASACDLCNYQFGKFESKEKPYQEKPFFMCKTCYTNWKRVRFRAPIQEKQAAIDYVSAKIKDTNIDKKFVESILPDLNKGKEELENQKRKELENQKKAEQQETQQALLRQRRAEIEKKSIDIIQKFITTGHCFDGYDIVDYHGIVSGESVLGTGFMSELSASVADILGEASTSFSGKMRRAKNLAIQNLVANAVVAGGNAIVSVDFDYITFGNNMIGVSANGTAVTVQKKD